MRKRTFYYRSLSGPEDERQPHGHLAETQKADAHWASAFVLLAQAAFAFA